MHIVSLNHSRWHSQKTSKDFIRNNKLLIILSIFLLSGIFCGAVLVKFFEKNTFDFVKVLFLQDLNERSSEAFFNIFMASVSSTFTFILPTFLMGLSAWGFVLAPTVPLLYGLCIGLASGYIYFVYGFHGMGCYALVFLPGIFISALAILLVAQESMFFSTSCFSTLFLKNTASSTLSTTKRYIFKTLSLACLAIVAGGIDVICSLILAHFFTV